MPPFDVIETVKKPARKKPTKQQSVIALPYAPHIATPVEVDHCPTTAKKGVVRHYHGTPIWGDQGKVHRVAVTGAGAFVSFARMDQLKASFEHAESVALDNGAFSAWKRGLTINWNDYYKVVSQYIDTPKLAFFVIPDVIEGGEEDNDLLISQLPSNLKHKAAPVWHLHESIDRLVRLCEAWPRVCFGSSGKYAVTRTKLWHDRMIEAFQAIYVERQLDVKIHGLRMLDGRVMGNYPLHTADSTNLACNVPKMEKKYPDLTKEVRGSSCFVDLQGDVLKNHIQMHRCAVMKGAIESVTPPTIMQWALLHPVQNKKNKTATSEYVRSPLKWAGGKFTQLNDLLPLLQGHERLIEPFVGGGSVFLNAGFKTVLANDNCHDLINTYQQLQERAYDVIGKAFQLFRLYNTPSAFLKIRDKFNAAHYTPVERAAAFIYLNRHCFNGLTRYNQSGAFNVGYGKYLAPYFPLDEIEAFADRCQGVTFSCGDYADAIAQAGAGDVVFCDPPYEPLAGKNGFTRYSNAQAFTFDDQRQLVDCVLAANQRGATIIMTNSGADSIKALYKAAGFDVRDVKVKRSMSSKGGVRKKAGDVIAVLKSHIPF